VLQTPGRVAVGIFFGRHAVGRFEAKASAAPDTERIAIGATENASRQKTAASVLIQSEPIGFTMKSPD
jgi:hypothetical protein